MIKTFHEEKEPDCSKPQAVKNSLTYFGDQSPMLLSIKQVAAFFQVSEVTIHNWKKNGKLQGFKRIGGRVYISQADCIKSLIDIKIQGGARC